MYRNDGVDETSDDNSDECKSTEDQFSSVNQDQLSTSGVSLNTQFRRVLSTVAQERQSTFQRYEPRSTVSGHQASTQHGHNFASLLAVDGTDRDARIPMPQNRYSDIISNAYAGQISAYRNMVHPSTVYIDPSMTMHPMYQPGVQWSNAMPQPPTMPFVLGNSSSALPPDMSWSTGGTPVYVVVQNTGNPYNPYIAPPDLAFNSPAIYMQHDHGRSAGLAAPVHGGLSAFENRWATQNVMTGTQVHEHNVQVPAVFRGGMPDNLPGFATASTSTADNQMMMAAGWEDSVANANLYSTNEPAIDSSEKSSNPNSQTRKFVMEKPKRPLSAYNIFFREERAKLMEEMKERGSLSDPDECTKKKAAGGGRKDVSLRRSSSQRLGSARKYRRKGQDKIGFENLAKIISQRWKNIDPQRLEECKKKAADDLTRYQAERALFKESESNHLSAKRGELEASVPDETLQRYFESID